MEYRYFFICYMFLFFSLNIVFVIISVTWMISGIPSTDIIVNTSVVLKYIDGWHDKYISGNMSIIQSCPSLNLQSEFQYAGNSIAYRVDDIIYDDKYQVLYKIDNNNTIFDGKSKIISIVQKYDKYYEFLNTNGSIIMMADLFGSDWSIRPNEDIDMRLYGLYLGEFSKRDRCYDFTNAVLIIDLFTVILTPILLGIWYVVIRHRKKSNRLLG